MEDISRTDLIEFLWGFKKNEFNEWGKVPGIWHIVIWWLESSFSLFTAWSLGSTLSKMVQLVTLSSAFSLSTPFPYRLSGLICSHFFWYRQLFLLLLHLYHFTTSHKFRVDFVPGIVPLMWECHLIFTTISLRAGKIRVIESRDDFIQVE